jgi:circadian clock protein KaiB
MHKIRLTLYIAGQTARSERAVKNLRRIGDTSLAGAYELDIIDVVEDPDAAEHARILTTPTLIKESPSPARRVTGDLSDHARVLVGLSIELTISDDNARENGP